MPAVKRRYRPNLQKHPVALFPSQWQQVQAYAEEHHEGVTARAVRALLGDALARLDRPPEHVETTETEAA